MRVRDAPVIDLLPHPITTEGRKVVMADPGMTIRDVMDRHMSYGMDAIVIHNGIRVERERWDVIRLREGDILNARVIPHGGGDGGSNPLAVILSIAVIVGAPFLAGALAGPLGITGAAGFGLLTAGIQLAGLLIVNSLFPPRLPELPNAAGAGQAPPQYSLSGGANRARPGQSLSLLFGAHRIFPDLASREYTEYDDNSDQFLNQIFEFPIGELSIGSLRLAETLLSSYESVETNSSSPSMLVSGNVDTIQGGDFGVVSGETSEFTRTTADKTTFIAVDLVSMHFEAEDDGSLAGMENRFNIEYRLSGGAWRTLVSPVIASPDGPDSRNAVRRSYKSSRLPEGVYDVRVQFLSQRPEEEDTTRITQRASVVGIRAFQDDKADFTGRNPLAIRIKATGQLYGRIDRLNADCDMLVSDWNGSDWNSLRATSNPASILLWWFRGYFVGGILRAGFGLSESEIDFESLQGWHAFCETENLECNVQILDDRHEDEIAMLIAQCGWARVDISTGKYGVIWENANSPATAVITPANVITGSLSIVYDNENLADEIIVTYLDRDSDWQQNTLRRRVPISFTETPDNTESGEFPVTVNLEGVTSGEQAAKECNRMAAAQFYHQRQVSWEMGDEGKVVSVGNVVIVSHGLVGSGQGGRLLGISQDRRTVRLPFNVDDDSGSAWIWELDDSVTRYEWTRTSAREIRLDAAIPQIDIFSENVENVEEHPSSYRIHLFSASGPSSKFRVTDTEATGPHRVKITARDEVDEYYAFRTSDLNSALIPIGGPVRPRPNGFVVSVTDFGTRYFSWSEPDVKPVGYEIRYGATRDWSLMLPIHEGLLPGSPYEAEDRPPEGDWIFGIVAVYEDGLRSSPVYARANLRSPGRVTRFREIEIYRVLSVTADRPERPEAEGSYDFETNVLTPPENWLAGPEFPSFTATQVVYACTTTADSSNGLIWRADADDWIGPYVVGDSDDLNIIYRRSDSLPLTPVPSAEIPAGWHDRISQVPGGQGLIYISIGRRERGSKIYTWQQPTQLEGQDGTVREFIFTLSDNIDLPESRWPDNAWTYNNPETRGGQTWASSALSVTEDMRYLYQTSRTVPATVSDGDEVSSVWLNPVVVGVFGPDGVQGVDGVDGEGIEYVFARTARIVSAIPANQLPSNNWAYDSPQRVGGLTWTDGGQTVTADIPLLWRSERKVPGSPAKGTAREETWGDWSTPVIVSTYGPDGADGTDGNGVEYVFARTADPTVSASQRPSNTWAYDRPGTSGGLTWTDGAPALSESLQYLWRSERRVPGSPAVGTARGESWGNWKMPVIVGRYATDGLPGQEGAPGQEGPPGGDGDDGQGIEFIFSKTTGATPSSPSNLWGFDQPVSPWFDAAPNLDAGDVLWMSQRRTQGVPKVGDAVSASWSSPRRISRAGVDGEPGDPAERRGAAIFRLRLNAAQTTIWNNSNINQGSTITNATINGLLNAIASEGGGPLNNDWVQVTGTADFGNPVWVTYDEDNTRWVASNYDFLAVPSIQAIDISAITGDFGDIKVTGVLSASHIDANVRNTVVLFSSRTGLSITSQFQSVTIENYDPKDFSQLLFTFYTGTESDGYTTGSIPGFAIPSSGTTGKFWCAPYVNRSGADDFPKFAVTSIGRGDLSISTVDGARARVNTLYSIVGFVNPGSGGSFVPPTTPTTPSTPVSGRRQFGSGNSTWVVPEGVTHVSYNIKGGSSVTGLDNQRSLFECRGGPSSFGSVSSGTGRLRVRPGETINVRVGLDGYIVNSNDGICGTRVGGAYVNINYGSTEQPIPGDPSTPTTPSTRRRVFYRRGTSAPSAPTSNAFSAYSSLSGWSTSNPGATATQDVYSVTLTQSFSSQTQSSSTFTGNTWSSVSRTEARTGTAAPTSAPTGIGASGTTLSWNSVTNATSYDIFWGLTPTSRAPVAGTAADFTSTTTSVTNSNIQTGRSFWVRARNSTGAGPWSSRYVYTASAPATPGTPTLTGRTASSLTFSVTPVPGATGYRWRISSNATVSNADTLRETTGPSITISGLSAGTQRWVDVRAENSAGNSSYSADATGTTTASSPTPSTRQRTFYRRGTSAPSAPTSNAFSAYTSLSGWVTTNLGATATLNVYSVTLTQSFSSQTQNSSTFTGNTWSAVTLAEARTGTSVPRLTGVFLAANGAVVSTNTTDNYYATFQYDDNASFSSPVTVYDTSLGQAHQIGLFLPQSARTGTVYVRGRLTTAANDGGTQGAWSATYSRNFGLGPVTEVPRVGSEFWSTSSGTPGEFVFARSPDVSSGTEPYASQYGIEFQFDATGFSKSNVTDNSLLYSTGSYFGNTYITAADGAEVGDTFRYRARFVRKSDNATGPWSSYTSRFTYGP